MWLIRASQSLDGFTVLQVETAGSFETLGPIYQIKGGISRIFLFFRLRFSRLCIKIVRVFSPAAILLGIQVCKTVPASKHRKV